MKNAMPESAGEASEFALLRRLWPFVQRERWAFLWALCVTPAIAGITLSRPYLLKRAIDDHMVVGVADGLATLALWYLAAVVGGYLLEASYTLALGWAGQRSIVRIRSHLYRHCLTLGQSFFDRQPAGKLLTRITSDVESLGESLTAGVVTIALDVLLIVGTVCVMAWLDLRLTLLLLLITPPLLIALEWIRRRLRRLFTTIREALASVNAFLAERVDGVEIIQLFLHERASANRFAKRNRLFRDACKQSNVYESLMYSLVDGAGRMMIALVLAYGAGLLWPDMEGTTQISVGVLVAFIDYLDRLFRPLRELSGKIAVIQRATAALAKIFWLFEVAEPPKPGTATVDRVQGHVVMEDVHFAYGDGPDILRGVNLDVTPGQVLAVVGATGSGKTTLTRLLTRTYDGYRGSIRLDGVEVSQIGLASLRRAVGVVHQDIQLFSETLRFNVSLGNPDVSDEGLVDALALVRADTLYNTLGGDHLVRERGSDLSVGQGQLITFARAMAHEPSLVILDEATASVDSLTEALIQDAIARILDAKTVIVIAHRLSTIQHADQILVMAEGRVVEKGTHDELMGAKGAYAGLVQAAEEAAGQTYA